MVAVIGLVENRAGYAFADTVSVYIRLTHAPRAITSCRRACRSGRLFCETAEGEHVHDPGMRQDPAGMLDYVIVIAGDVDKAREG